MKDALQKGREKLKKVYPNKSIPEALKAEKKQDKISGDDEDMACETPGEKIRSGGLGRGLARGKGRGPVGIPVGEKEAAYTLGAKLAALDAGIPVEVTEQEASLLDG